jgi:Protein of unknown function (DUF1329)
MKSLRLLWGTVIATAMVVGLCGVAAAQATYDVASYQALADADSNDTIPPGTKITVQNWQKYKKFMQIWMQQAFSGHYKWHIGTGPEYTVEVAPTQHYPLIRKYVEDTEKYGGQAKLIPLGNGAFTWKGYVAGLPFPNPQEPNRAVKLAYDNWGDFRPKIMDFFAYNWQVDSYGNVTNLQSEDTFYRLMHLSDPPDAPTNLPFANGTYYVSRFMVVLPEQSKYSTELTLRPDDPTRIEEIYAFVPSLRRSLRLSSAARCAPILGTDFVEDDNAWMPTNFKITLLGKKKLLAAIIDYDKAFNRDNYVQPPGTFPGWPKYGAVHWELRDYYILNLEWLTSLGAYCYSQRVFYDDTETLVSNPLESYDREGHFWKVVWAVATPVDFRGQHTLMDIASIGAIMAIDFQNSHVTETVESPTTIDEDGAGSKAGPVPVELRNMAEMTTPGSLSRVMK